MIYWNAVMLGLGQIQRRWPWKYEALALMNKCLVVPAKAFLINALPLSL